MFKKLVSNLPYNPSLIHQVGFYADRLRAEKSVRRISFVFMALALVVQSFAVIAPPERSLGLSNNHILSNPQTKNDILAAYDNPNGDIKDIYTRFNLKRADIVNLTNTPNVTVFSGDGQDWFTIGRTSLSNYPKVSDFYKRHEFQVQYRGQGTSKTSDDAFVYGRSLRAWDIINKSGNYYKAWKGKSSTTGQTFWILQSCGNITWVGTWKDPEPEPDPDPSLYIKKTVKKTEAVMNPGDTYSYRIEYRNKVIGSTAHDVEIRDQLDVKKYDFVGPKNDRRLKVSSTGFLTYDVGDLKGSHSAHFIEITVRLKDPLPSPTKVCNDASIHAKNAGTRTSDDVCINVITECPYDDSVPNVNNPNCVEPKVVCTALATALDRTNRKATFKTTVSSTNKRTTKIKSYVYDFGDGSEPVVVTSDKYTDTQMRSYDAGAYDLSVKIRYTAQGVDGEQESDACTSSISFEEDQPLSEKKTVINITRELDEDETLGTNVHGGDVLEYTLHTLNTQDYDRVDVEVTDYIGDVLDYATLDTEFLEEQGGRYDKDSHKVIWEDQTVEANSVLELKFRVTMKDPIPATNRVSEGDPDYDCVISNEYGNTVNLNVSCPVVKAIETLPNTGPGTSLAATTLITAVAGYFFARSRLFSKEIDLIRTDYAVTGGA